MAALPMHEHATPSDFSELVGQIYDCAIDAQRWPETLTALRAHLGFATAVLSLHALPSGRTLLQATSGIASPWLERIADYESDIMDLWGGASVARLHPLDRPAVVSRINPSALDADTGNRYAREWAFPQGLMDSMALPLARDPFAFGAIGLGWHRDSGTIGDAQLARAERMLPHLQRAAAISRLLEAHSASATAFVSVIDGLATPVVLVARDRTIIHANSAARSLLKTDGTLSDRGNVLTAKENAVAQALAAAVARCATNDVPRADGLPPRDVEPVGIAVRSAAGVHALHVLPLRGGAVRSQLIPEAVAAIFVGSPGARPDGAGQAAAALFGLTPAETRVFDQIASGLTPAEVARALGVAPSTVRTHLLRLFAKVGVRRQADIVHLASSLASPLG